METWWHLWISALKVYETSKVASKSETDGVADAGGAAFFPHPSLLWGDLRTPGWIFPSMRSLSECQQWCLITAQQTDHKSLPIMAQVYTLAPVIDSLKQQQWVAAALLFCRSAQLNLFLFSITGKREIQNKLVERKGCDPLNLDGISVKPPGHCQLFKCLQLGIHFCAPCFVGETLLFSLLCLLRV